MISSNSRMSIDVKIGSNVIIRDNVELYPGVVIEDNCEVEANTIIKNNVIIKNGTFIGANSIIGEYTKDYFTSRDSYRNEVTIIGRKSIIRSGCIIYSNVFIGDNFESGHRVTIREKSIIGNNVSIGTMSDLQGDLLIGDYVRFHSNVHIGMKSIVEDYVWIYPNVVLTNDPYPPMGNLIGVKLCKYSQIATGSVIMPGVMVGENALVGAKSLVKKDVDTERVVVGIPAKDICSVRDIRDKNGKQVYPWKEFLTDFRGYPWQIDKPKEN